MNKSLLTPLSFTNVKVIISACYWMDVGLVFQSDLDINGLVLPRLLRTL